MLFAIFTPSLLLTWLVICSVILLLACFLLIRLLKLLRELLPHLTAQTKLLSMIAYKQGVPVDDIEFIMYDIHSIEKLRGEENK